MSGFAYTVPYSLMGLVAGYFTNYKHRNLVLAITVCLAGIVQCLNGMNNIFAVFVLLRVLHGAISSVLNPLSYAVVADYYPPNKRGVANAFLSSGNFVGIGLSATTILLIKEQGWKQAYITQGICGLVASVIGLLILRKPRVTEYQEPVE